MNSDIFEVLGLEKATEVDDRFKNHIVNGLTYLEAKQLCDQLTQSWDDYYKAHGSPAFSAFEELAMNSPDGIYSYNSVTRCPGFRVAENDGRVYEFPAGLMAWGDGIPEEAYLSDDILEKKLWMVISRRETYDW